MQPCFLIIVLAREAEVVFYGRVPAHHRLSDRPVIGAPNHLPGLVVRHRKGRAQMVVVVVIYMEFAVRHSHPLRAHIDIIGNHVAITVRFLYQIPCKVVMIDGCFQRDNLFCQQKTFDLKRLKRYFN